MPSRWRRDNASSGQDDNAAEPNCRKIGRNVEVDFHGEKRSNDTPASRTDPEARLYRKGPGKEARLSLVGHALMENRSGLIVDACLAQANGHAERVAALALSSRAPTGRAESPSAPSNGVSCAMAEVIIAR